MVRHGGIQDGNHSPLALTDLGRAPAPGAKAEAADTRQRATMVLSIFVSTKPVRK